MNECCVLTWYYSDRERVFYSLFIPYNFAKISRFLGIFSRTGLKPRELLRLLFYFFLGRSVGLHLCSSPHKFFLSYARSTPRSSRNPDSDGTCRRYFGAQVRFSIQHSVCLLLYNDVPGS